jgi:hypothetical protein
LVLKQSCCSKSSLSKKTIEPAPYNPDISPRQCIHIFHYRFCSHPTRRLLNANDDKYFGWNFLNLLEDGKTTIEFRRPTGVKSAKECLAWVEFTVTFVQATVQSRNHRKPNLGEFLISISTLPAASVSCIY